MSAVKLGGGGGGDAHACGHADFNCSLAPGAHEADVQCAASGLSLCGPRALERAQLVNLLGICRAPTALIGRGKLPTSSSSPAAYTLLRCGRDFVRPVTEPFLMTEHDAIVNLLTTAKSEKVHVHTSDI